MADPVMHDLALFGHVTFGRSPRELINFSCFVVFLNPTGAPRFTFGFIDSA